MRFEVHVHPGRACGVHDDGSYCWTDGDAHFSVPPPARSEPADPSDWDGWEDVGYITED